MLEVEDFVKVSDPIDLLFDVLAVLDAFCALLTAAAVLCFSLMEMKTWIPGTSLSTLSSGFPGSAGCAGSAASLERSFSRVLGT